MFDPDRLAAIVTTYSKSVIAVMLVMSLVMGAGMAQLDQSAGLDQFEFETEEGDAQEYVETNFDVSTNETNVQIVMRDQENALSRASFIETLELQEELRADPDINATLSDPPFGDLASIVATQAIAEEEGAALADRGEELAQDRADLENRSANLAEGINATRDLQTEYTQLNASYAAGEINESTYEANASAIESDIGDVETANTADLDEEQTVAYLGMLAEARSLQDELVQTEIAYESGEMNESARDEEVAGLEEDLTSVYDGIQTDVFGAAFAALGDRADALESDEEDLASLDPTIEEQRDQLEGMSDADVADVVGQVLGEDADRAAFTFVPTDFEPGETEADARQLFVTQSTTSDAAAGAASEDLVESQLEIADYVDERYGEDGFTYGAGVITDEINRSMSDSLGIVLPLALLFVLVVLTIAYRDPLDILLGLGGIGLVLVWTFGFIGWAGMSFNQIMIAVPVLLVGLSIDYAIHVFMRHREQRADDATGSRPAMRAVIVGLGAALLWVTVTAVIGFLSNLVSPVPPIQDFGIVSAFGIFATLAIFGVLVPAAKVSLDDFLEHRGWDRRKQAFGTGGGVLTGFLQSGSRVAQRAPFAILVIVILLTSAGLYGAAQVDTQFDQEDFIADEPPEWTESLPGPLAPGEYSVKANLDFVNERFLRQDASSEVLIRGGVGANDSLERMHAAEQTAADADDVVITLSDGSADVRSPLGAMRDLAENDPDFESIYTDADANGDEVPDRNVTGVYDAFFDAAPEEAGQYLHRTDDGEYEAARIVISTQGDASASEVTDATRDIADTVDGDDQRAIATGQLVVFNVIEDGLFDAVLESLLVTFVAVFAFLMAAYRVIHGSAILGAVTLTPIVLTVAWILGTMHVLDIPFNVMTGTITSLTIGLGVAYNIHIAERYQLERGRGHSPTASMERAVTGTGGALLGSAATTVGGFGVLIFAILPPLQQFGLITGLTIVYAFLGSVLILPSFLALWSRYLGDD